MVEEEKNKKNCLSDPITEYRMYRNKFILNEIDLFFVVAGKLHQFGKNKKALYKEIDGIMICDNIIN